MIIGIDARMLGPKQGGIGRYTQEIIEAFPPKADPPTAEKHENNDDGFVVFLRKENWDLVEETPKIKKILADIPWYGWREQFLLAKIIKKEKIDLMHFPHWNIPIFYNQPFVVTIHDLLLLHYPTRAASTLGPVAYFFKNIAYRLVLKHAIKKSEQIITPSEYTRQDIIKNFNVSPDKISVIYLAATPLTEIRNQKSEIRNDLADKYRITKPYILYVGVAYPHKNLEGLIKAWDIFCAQHGNNYQLVLAGRKNYFYDRLEQSVRGNDNIIFTGYIPDENLPVLYQNASLYIFPSLYEGFGLPPLEAMQYDLPVASSTATCLPEILKDAVIYFDPRNPDAMATAIWRGLTDQKLRESLTQKSVQLIHNYSWITTARQTLEVYHSVI
ncbi:MAG: glycosyltransferase family 1 protein [Patescibacteria group bacterium]|nr:glycosyltransferase family 1 protein [Patescibacteria group bacterium]